MAFHNKLKNFNDPVYGFITIPNALVFDIIEHPWFQRLRRIKQLGLSLYVYPGAVHTRFQHVIGAMSLAQHAMNTLRLKGVEITDEEYEAVLAALLLHDIGHGPYSHTLERVLVQNISHERISLQLMERMNAQMNGRLTKCISIFTGEYPKHFLHQLVSSQLDMDRLDYLRRDSFFSGVQEGVVGQDRIINMLNVFEGELVVDEKGIYSVEKFLIARRLMYWQVYLHKTVVAVETLLVKLLERAFEMSAAGEKLFATPSLAYFLLNQPNGEPFFQNEEAITNYTQLDDDDIMSSLKAWCTHPDPILRELSLMLRDRHLPAVELADQPFDEARVMGMRQQLMQQRSISMQETKYFIFTDSVKNRAYYPDGFHINILFKDGQIRDITKASDQDNIVALAKPVTKYFLCYPKTLLLRD